MLRKIRTATVHRPPPSRGRNVMVRVAASSRHVCVVGGGVAGLTTALRLLRETQPTVTVTVVAEAFGNDLVSSGAAGFWEPYKLSRTPEDRVVKWGSETYEHLRDLLHSPDAAAAGVSSVRATSLFRAPTPDPFWASAAGGVTRAPRRDLELYSSSVDWSAPDVVAAAGGGGGDDGGDDGNGGGDSGSGIGGAPAPAPAPAALLPDRWVDGYRFDSFLCEGRLYTRWLLDRVREEGGALEQRGLDGLGDLADDGYDAVVVAAGLGSKALLGDSEVYPIRGQVARVRAPWVRECVFGHWGGETTYIIPNRDCVVVGGTGQVGDWRAHASLDDAESVLARAAQLLPSIAGAEVVEHWAGLRPGRTEVRLEMELVDLRGGGWNGGGDEGGDGDDGNNGVGSGGGGGGGPRTPVVYCYGHGGAGLTLAWGTAGEAVGLVKRALGV